MINRQTEINKTKNKKRKKKESKKPQIKQQQQKAINQKNMESVWSWFTITGHGVCPGV